MKEAELVERVQKLLPEDKVYFKRQYLKDLKYSTNVYKDVVVIRKGKLWKLDADVVAKCSDEYLHQLIKQTGLLDD